MLNVIDLLDLSHIEETIGADFGLLNLKTFNMQHGLYNTLKEKVSFKTLFGIVCILCDLVPPTPPTQFRGSTQMSECDNCQMLCNIICKLHTSWQLN